MIRIINDKNHKNHNSHPCSKRYGGGGWVAGVCRVCILAATSTKRPARTSMPLLDGEKLARQMNKDGTPRCDTRPTLY
eukprot:251927-Prorocentrum_minimum.AAC.2